MPDEQKTSGTVQDEANRPGDQASRGADNADEDTDAAEEKEIGGREGPDPTRYGDWEKNGRCIDF